ncbi:hydrocephalus-inducing protein-like [Vidua macroura]|uniref:hydrocephalus-inducing protein-like n=1 Tax=Vidua macroura TaxID=187451 RepID=UPI0023A7F009|nr:hydrocephalus-inducing protein-like [Vidua macroura]
MSGGFVTGLSSHFDLNKLDFKDISSGSRNTKTRCLTHTSSVSRIALWGEAHFPNLQIQPSRLEFVGGTEGVRSLEMTNCSSLPVKYRWSFRSEDKLGYEPYPLKFKPQPPKEQRTCLDSSAYKRRFLIRKEEAGTALKEVQDFAQSLGAEAFSILPLSGVLQPGQSQQVSFTFSGHRDVLGGVKALCRVEGGPTYEVELITSRVSYSLSLWEIDCGSQMFNEIGHSTVTLENTGRIEFSWVLKPSTADQHLPGVFLVNPTTGSMAPGEKQALKFSYMPGLPGAFSRIYQLKVGDLEPKNILLKGEASFPVITVNLPWNTKENEKYEQPLKQHVKHLQQYSQRNKSEIVQKIQSLKTDTLKSQTLKTQTPKSQTSETRDPKTQDLKPRVPGSGIVPSTQLQMNTVRMLIEKAALELQQKLTCHPPKSRFPDKQLCQSLVKVELPEYVLDMGTVLKGFTERSTLEITNPGQIPVSFQVDESVLQDTGFSVDLGLMKSLAPSQTMAFTVCFESARWPQGDVDVLLPIEVTKGPTSHIRLRATVLEASLDLSKNTLQFSDILLGQCQVETIRLYNRFQAPCKWSIEPVLKRVEGSF